MQFESVAAGLELPLVSAGPRLLEPLRKAAVVVAADPDGAVPLDRPKEEQAHDRAAAEVGSRRSGEAGADGDIREFAGVGSPFYLTLPSTKTGLAASFR